MGHRPAHSTLAEFQQRLIDNLRKSSSASLRNQLLTARASVGTDFSAAGSRGLQARSFILGNVPQELQRRDQNAIASAANKAFASLEKDFFGKLDATIAEQDFRFEQISEASRSFDVQLGNFQREQEDIERGIITSQSQINMGSQNNLLLIGAAVVGLFLLG